jgi:hypothetical protein
MIASLTPDNPPPSLRARSPAFALGIFKDALDPVTLPLHLPQMQDRSINRSIGQAIFDRLLRFDLAPDNQMPTPGCVFLAMALVHSPDRVRVDPNFWPLRDGPPATDGFEASGRQHSVQDRHADSSLGRR